MSDEIERKFALVPVANGTEELEAITVIDTFRRAGIETIVAGLDKLHGTDDTPSVVTCARQSKIEPDRWLESASVQEHRWDAIVLVGGLGGAQAFARSPVIARMVKEQLQHGRIVASICASPALVLAPLGVLDGVRATCFPHMLDKLPLPSQERVVQAGNIWTSQGPGTSLDFALALVAALSGHETAKRVADGMLTSLPTVFNASTE